MVPCYTFLRHGHTEADALLPVHNGMIKLNFKMYQAYNIQFVTLGSFWAYRERSLSLDQHARTS